MLICILVSVRFLAQLWSTLDRFVNQRFDIFNIPIPDFCIKAPSSILLLVIVALPAVAVDVIVIELDHCIIHQVNVPVPVAPFCILICPLRFIVSLVPLIL